MKLKTQLLAAFISLFSLNAMAQIPNASFENLLSNGQLSNWGAVFMFPVSIDTNGSSFTDSIVFDNYFYAPSTEANFGNHALELRNAMDYTVGWPIVGQASVDTDTIYSAWGNTEIIPIQSRPLALTFSYQYFPVAGEMGAATLTLTDSSGNVIGEAYVELDSTTAGYEYVTAPVNYLNNDPVAYYSLNFRNAALGCFIPGFGTRMLIDDVGMVLSATTGIDEQAGSDLTLYPNPANDQLYLLSQANTFEAVQLFDAKGTLVLESGFTTTLDISRLQPGLYTLRTSGNGGMVNKKFIKQ